MFPIFKVHHVMDNKISKIYAFIGNENISEEESFATINQRLNIFTPDEFSYIQSNGIIIQYINKVDRTDIINYFWFPAMVKTNILCLLAKKLSAKICLIRINCIRLFFL